MAVEDHKSVGEGVFIAGARPNTPSRSPHPHSDCVHVAAACSPFAEQRPLQFLGQSAAPATATRKRAGGRGASGDKGHGRDLTGGSPSTSSDVDRVYGHE